MATQGSKGSSSLLDELPVDRLKEEAINLGKTLAKRGAAKIGERLTGAPGKLGDLTDAVPGPKDVVKAVGKAASPMGPVKDAASKVKDAIPGVGSDDDDEDGEDGGGGKSTNSVGDDTNLKVTNIVESIDVPVSRDVAYELWTQFEEFPSFMKKVETVNQKDPEVVTWKAQIFWSHRTWTAKIVDQVPPERIVWKSEADKGKVDGAVTFHELAPDLTRVLVSLEYFPQGLFERTGNLWRAQGRRVRLELKHFRRHVANHALINQDEVDGWGGEIHDGKVKRRGSSSTAKTSTSNGSTAKKSSSSGSTAKKSTSSGSAAKKSAAKKSSSGGSTAKKSTSASAQKSASSGSAAKKSAAKKSSSGGSTAKKSSARKAPSKRTAAAAKRSSTTSKRTSAATSRTRKSTSAATKTARSSGRSRATSKKS